MTTTKRSIVDDALRNTANNLSVDADQTATLADQSFEWQTGSAIYDRELLILLERHPWFFARGNEALEQVDTADNPSNRYGYGYEWPYDALWLEKVQEPGGLDLTYELIGRIISMDYNGTEANDDQPVATFIKAPELSDATNLFFAILTAKVEVGLLRAINEDYAEASRREKQIEGVMLPLFANRNDQQNAPRKAFRSRMRERRRSGGGPTAL